MDTCQGLGLFQIIFHVILWVDKSRCGLEGFDNGTKIWKQVIGNLTYA